MMRSVTCTLDQHAEAVLGILNEAIEKSTAIYEYSPRPSSSMKGWFTAKDIGGFPVVGAESESGELIGFATTQDRHVMIGGIDAANIV